MIYLDNTILLRLVRQILERKYSDSDKSNPARFSQRFPVGTRGFFRVLQVGTNLRQPPDRGDPHTAVAGGKRRAIDISLAKQQGVLLQVTHWFASALGIWEAGTFLHSRVVPATARPGNEGGPQGGVAIVCPLPPPRP